MSLNSASSKDHTFPTIQYHMQHPLPQKGRFPTSTQLVRRSTLLSRHLHDLVKRREQCICSNIKFLNLGVTLL
ncbi:unnamed protein product [Ixodes persulcatus]